MAVRNPTVIAAGSITEANLGNEAVTPGKTKLATIPTPSGTENTIILGTAGVARKFVAAFTGNAAATAVKIKHGLETQATVAFAQKSSAKLPTELPTTALGKWVSESSTEGTFTFTAAPGAKEEVFITVVG